MPDYSKGKIYTIRCLNDPNVYVGSTIQSLAVRMGGHRKAYVENKVLGLNKEIVTNIDDWKIELHELYPCLTKQELHRREGEIIRLLGTLNKQIAGRTVKEYRTDNAEKIFLQQKEYAKKNEVKIKERTKKYRIKNVDKTKEYSKEYYIKNADKIKEYNKEYRIENDDKIKEKKNKYMKEYSSREEIKTREKEYREKNKEKHMQYMKEYHSKKKSNLIIKEDE